MSKGFKASSPSSGDFEDDITLDIAFANQSDKDIRAFDGSMTFTDLLDNKILISGVSINKLVKAGGVLHWSGEIKYNQFKEDHQRLRNEDKENIKLVFSPKKILFADGTVQNIE